MGVIKKAMQLGILTGCEISLVMIDHESGESFHYSSAEHAKNTVNNLEKLSTPSLPFGNDHYYEMFNEDRGDDVPLVPTPQSNQVRVEEVATAESVYSVSESDLAKAQQNGFVWNGMYQFPNGVCYYPIQTPNGQNGQSFEDYQVAQIPNWPSGTQTPLFAQDAELPESEENRKRKRDEEDEERITEKKRKIDDEASNDSTKKGELDLRIKIPNNPPSYFMMPLSPTGGLLSTGLTPKGNYSPTITPMSPSDSFGGMYYFNSGFTPTGFTPTGFTPNSLFSPVPFFFGNNSQKEKT